MLRFQNASFLRIFPAIAGVSLAVSRIVAAAFGPPLVHLLAAPVNTLGH